MNISHKMVKIVIISILIMSLPITLLMYAYVQHKVIANASIFIEQSTGDTASIMMQRFSQIEPKLSSLAHILEKELAKPTQAKEIESFHKVFEQNPDGIWRNRKSDYDGKLEAGLFLPLEAEQSDIQKVHHLRIKQIIDTFGAAASKPLENVWYLSPQRSEIIFDRNFPSFAFDQKADNDYTQTDWVTLTSPQRNPKREFRLTPPLYDPVPKVWMISGLYPLYVNGQWIGSLGEDIQLTNVLEAMLFNHQIYQKTEHFLLDNQNNYILAGHWQKQLETNPNSFQLDLSRELPLAKLLKSQLTEQPQTMSNELMVGGKRYMAIGMLLEPLHWKYYRLVPIDAIMEHTRRMFYILGGSILLVAGLTGLMIGVVINARITRRIKLLSNVMKQYVDDKNQRIHGRLDDDDEISEAANIFDEMADHIDNKAAIQKLADNKLRTLLVAIEQSPTSIVITDLNGNLQYVNPQFTCITGYSADEAIGANPSILQSGLTSKETFHEMWETVTAGKVWKGELINKRKNGEIYFEEAHISPVVNDTGEIIQYVGVKFDITERKQAEHQQLIAATVFEESQIGMIVTDANAIILRVNKAFTSITGYSTKEVIGRNPHIISSGNQTKEFYAAMWRSLNKRGAWEGEIWNRRKNGEAYPEYLAISSVKESNGNVINYVATLIDITESKAASDEIKSLAFYDQLTKLPNRRLLLDRLKHTLIANGRKNSHGALLFIDLDHFKTINDTLGHNIGDLLLQQAATRLNNCVREGDTVARLGGDEFVVLLEGLSENQLDAATNTDFIGSEILSVLNQPYKLTSHHYHCTCSIGATLFSDSKTDVDDLLKQADIAMYDAKESGRNTLHFYDPGMQEKINSRVAMEGDLRKAIENSEFQLHYQIQIDRSGKALGAEALIRWNHPEQGMLSPFNFIPLAEKSGLILPIGLWVLETACAQLKLWEQHVLTRNLSISINVSAEQFKQTNFVDQIQSIVRSYAINPMLLKLELTESMLVDHIDDIIIKMNKLQALGVRFELDDFGTGYSSLQYLKKLPLYQLKIDQSFVHDIATDSSDQAIVHTIIAMAESLNLEVIAEGVESEEQLAQLKSFGCNNFQGYLFSKPLPIDEFEAMLGNM